MFIDYYEILGISYTSSEEQIKKAYRLNAVKYHPDKHNNDQYFTKKFQAINEAYQTLSDPLKKADYDVFYSTQVATETEEADSESGTRYSYTYDHTSAANRGNNGKDKKKDEKQAEEQFRYDPYKQFYSPFDRDQQETPQFAPTSNIFGEKLSDNLDFFKLPKNIGKIIGGYSDLRKDVEPLSSSQKTIKSLKYFGVALLIGTAIYFVASLVSPIWIAVWFILPIAIALWLSNAVAKFKHTNLYVGINGFAQYVCEDSRDNIVTDKEINFNNMTDFYSHYTEVNRNYVYQHTSFVYVCLDRNTMKIVFAASGEFNKKSAIKQQGILINYYRTIERYWTVYLLDRLENELQAKGYITFSLYAPKQNAIQTYIKLGVGFITFIKAENQEFTYKFTDIKKVYAKGSELRIQHKNFEKTLFFFKSGNEDVIPMLNLCNRHFFYKALELLLGYSI